jgi:hypothetical protein
LIRPNADVTAIWSVDITCERIVQKKNLVVEILFGRLYCPDAELMAIIRSFDHTGCKAKIDCKG